MTYYLGVDAHKKYSVVAVATEDGTFKTIVRIENTIEEVHKLFTSFGEQLYLSGGFRSRKKLGRGV